MEKLPIKTPFQFIYSRHPLFQDQLFHNNVVHGFTSPELNGDLKVGVGEFRDYLLFLRLQHCREDKLKKQRQKRKQCFKRVTTFMRKPLQHLEAGLCDFPISLFPLSASCKCFRIISSQDQEEK